MSHKIEGNETVIYKKRLIIYMASVEGNTQCQCQTALVPEGLPLPNAL